MAPVIGGLTLPVEHCLVRLVPVVYREPNGPLLAHLVEPWYVLKLLELFDANIFSCVGYISRIKY
jgi:hypothetical protein